MKQNIYDDPEFFAGYANLRDGEKGLNSVLEGPALASLLPDPGGKRVLDLGCGFGDFCARAAEGGAARVLGVDISGRMLEEARRRHPRLEFVRAAVEEYRIAPGSFDLVVSSLCLHYVRDIAPLFLGIHAGLSAGGIFAFSVEHPICTALLRGWARDDRGNRLHWPVDRYREEGVRTSRWFVDGVVKYHRTVETYVNTLIDAGFAVGRLLEPEATPESLSARPELSEERRRPPFLLLQAVKRNA